jgi:hypothetical protein
MLLGGLRIATAAEDCRGALRACKIANKGGQQPDSKECKQCQAAYDGCVTFVTNCGSVLNLQNSTRCGWR